MSGRYVAVGWLAAMAMAACVGEDPAPSTAPGDGGGAADGSALDGSGDAAPAGHPDAGCARHAAGSYTFCSDFDRDTNLGTDGWTVDPNAYFAEARISPTGFSRPNALGVNTTLEPDGGRPPDAPKKKLFKVFASPPLGKVRLDIAIRVIDPPDDRDLQFAGVAFAGGAFRTALVLTPDKKVSAFQSDNGNVTKSAGGSVTDPWSVVTLRLDNGARKLVLSIDDVVVADVPLAAVASGDAELAVGIPYCDRCGKTALELDDVVIRFE